MSNGLDPWLARELASLEGLGLRRRPPEIQDRHGTRVTVEGRELLCFASNNYLGLADHPALIAAARGALESAGFGAGASRMVSGTFARHRRAERALADHADAEDSLLFSSGYAANTGALGALLGPDDVAFSDALNHASLIDGLRLARAPVVVYPHGDAEALRALMERTPTTGRRWIVTEAIFSMDGDRAPLAALRSIADAHDACLYVDEAHALGVVGPAGAGLSADVGVRPDVLVGTLGKAFGAFGAFVAGSSLLRDWLVHRARSFVFSTAPPPLVGDVALAALGLVRASDAARATLRRHATRLRSELRAMGHTVPPGDSPIVPVLLGDPHATMALAGQLRERGIFVQGIRPPTVPEGTSRLRLVPMATHTEADLDAALDAFRALRPPVAVQP